MLAFSPPHRVLVTGLQSRFAPLVLLAWVIALSGAACANAEL